MRNEVGVEKEEERSRKEKKKEEGEGAAEKRKRRADVFQLLRGNDKRTITGTGLSHTRFPTAEL